ncbi:MAG: hypothetical protein ACREQW_21730 [Candidatus Binatia bacterium]
MSSENQDLTRDNLIQKGLEGKDKAIAAYDEMLWKIRTGYATVLYGVFTLVVSLGDKTKWLLSIEKAGLVALTLITGFTICAAALDFSVLRSKFRVIQAKEELVDLALRLASGGNLEEWTGSSLNTLLHNSGEGLAQVEWKARSSVWPIALLYLGTWGPLSLAVLFMMA